MRSLDPNVKMNPPLRCGGRPRGADRGPARRDDRARSRPTTRRTRGTRRTCRSRRRRSASPASRRRSRRSTRTSSSPGSLPLETLLERMSAGPARAFGLERAADRGRRARRTSSCSTSSATWRVDGGRLPLALGELVAARRDAQGQGAADGRRRPGGLRGMTRLPRARGRHGLPRRARSAPTGFCARRGRLHDRDDRLPGDRHRPELRRAARLLHGADGRQLRRRAGRAPSRARPHARAVLMREARGPAWTDWLRERGIVALDGIDTRSLVLHLRDRGAMRAAASPATGSRRSLTAARRSPRWRAGRWSRGVSTAEPYVCAEHGRRARRGRRLRLQALDPAPARRRPARRSPSSRTTSTRTSCAGHDGVAPLERPRRPGAARATRSRRCATCSAACRSSASASATSCSRSPPATRRSSSRSAIAARTIRCSSARRAACSSRARTTASPSRRRTTREATHVSLYDGTVEGLRLPASYAPLGAVPSRGRAGAARRLAAHRDAGSRRWRYAAAA